MTLLTVTRDVCAVVGVLAPQSVFSNITGNRAMQEMLALANEMAQRIAYDYRDWTQLIKTATITGDGTTTAFNLPANYKRMITGGNVWRSTSSVDPMINIGNADDWINRRARGWNDAFGEWTMMGGQIHVYPALADGETIYFAYLDKNCVALAGGFGTEFQTDADNFVLDERLLKLGMIWQWKANKGAAYADDMGTYGDAMGSVMGRDKPAQIIVGHGGIVGASPNVLLSRPLV